MRMALPSYKRENEFLINETSFPPYFQPRSTNWVRFNNSASIC